MKNLLPALALCAALACGEPAGGTAPGAAPVSVETVDMAGLEAAPGPNHGEPVQVRHAHVAEHGVEGLPARQDRGLEPGQSLAACRGPDRPAAQPFDQPPGQQRVDVIVLGNEDPAPGQRLAQAGLLGFRHDCRFRPIPVAELGRQRTEAHRLDEIAVEACCAGRAETPPLIGREKHDMALASRGETGPDNRPRRLDPECRIDHQQIDRPGLDGDKRILRLAHHAAFPAGLPDLFGEERAFERAGRENQHLETPGL